MQWTQSTQIIHEILSNHTKITLLCLSSGLTTSVMQFHLSSKNYPETAAPLPGYVARSSMTKLNFFCGMTATS